VALEPVLTAQEQTDKIEPAIWHLGQCDEPQLRDLIENHFRYTGSFRSKEILHDWAKQRTRFVKVFPNEYKRALRQLYEARPASDREKLAA
jgi:glutamate synthase (NADPH) large chain